MEGRNAQRPNSKDVDQEVRRARARGGKEGRVLAAAAGGRDGLHGVI